MSDTVQLPIPARLAPLFTAVNKRIDAHMVGVVGAKTRPFALPEKSPCRGRSGAKFSASVISHIFLQLPATKRRTLPYKVRRRFIF